MGGIGFDLAAYQVLVVGGEEHFAQACLGPGRSIVSFSTTHFRSSIPHFSSERSSVATQYRTVS
eukprot:320895-Rhodomonas_salina.2